MSLKMTSVNKCLDKKLQVFGFEVFDLFAVFLLLSILNFLFGESGHKFMLVWLPTALLTLTLRLGKRGKPDGFLIHWVRYQIKPGIFKSWNDRSNLFFVHLRRKEFHDR